MKKNKVVYLDKLAEYTLLGLRKCGINNYELFVEYAEPHQARWIDHICSLPDESFEINDDAIAVFSKQNDKLVLRDVYDLEYHRFVVKDKVGLMYKEKFKKHYKVKK